MRSPSAQLPYATVTPRLAAASSLVTVPASTGLLQAILSADREEVTGAYEGRGPLQRSVAACDLREASPSGIIESAQRTP